jgi:DNA-binding CsgD family transcriptional regulator
MVLRDDAIFALIERAYAAGCEPALWPEFVTEVQALFPGTLVGLQLSLNETALASHSSAAGIADEYFRSYFDHYQFTNPYPAFYARCATGEVQTSGTLLGAADIRTYPFYHEWLKPAGDFTRGSGATLLRDKKRLLHFSINIPDCIGHIEPSTAHFLRKMAPHLLRAFQLNERLEAQTVATAVLDKLMDRLDGAIFVISYKGRVLLQNQEAEAFARKTAILRFGVHEQLSFCVSKNDEMYRHVLDSILDPTKPPATTSFLIDCGDLGMKTATLLPVQVSRDGDLLADGPSALLIINTGRGGPSPRQILQTLYRLTKAEAEVAIRIASGSSPAEIADELGVSKTTVRNQLSAVMSKMGVKRQAQIAALSAALRPTLKVED